MDKPLAIELYAGTGSGTAGWCALGGRSVNFDLDYLPHHGTPEPGAYRVIQDVLTLDGAQFKDADFIWGSSPCQAYSYLAMPWSRSKCPLCKGKKEYFAWQIENRPPANMADWGDPIMCDCKENSAKAKELRRRWELDGPDNTLFDSVSRIAREASAAAGRIIPFVQENVRGAVPWVGKRDMSLATWKSLTQEQKIAAGRPDAVFGSFFLWGNCGQIGKRVIAGRDLADIRAGRGRFGMGVAPEKAVKVPSFRFDGSGRSFQTASVEATGQKENPDGTNHPKGSWFGIADSKQGDRRSGQKTPGRSLSKGAKNKFGTHNMGSAEKIAAELGLTNQAESDAVRDGATKIGGDWFSDPNSTCRKHGSKSNARKAASALIAVIPKALSTYIAEQHYPS